METLAPAAERPEDTTESESEPRRSRGESAPLTYDREKKPGEESAVEPVDCQQRAKATAEVSKHERKVVIKGGKKKTRPRKNTSTLIGQTEEEPRHSRCVNMQEKRCANVQDRPEMHTRRCAGEAGPTRM